MVKIDRRKFLQIVGSATAAALLSRVPEIGVKAPKPKASAYGEWDSTTVSSGGVLTQEMIEEAALKAVENFGTPDEIIFVDEASWNAFIAEYPRLQEALV